VIKKYHFNTLSLDDSLIVEEESVELPVEKIEENRLQEQDEKVEDDSFISELLKKTDDLSSNVIKLQMQIEKQQSEFNKRLEEEKKKAFEEGKKEGEESIKEKLQDEIEEIKDQYIKSIASLNELNINIQNRLDVLENDLSTTAVDIATKVIKQELDEDSSKIAKILAVSLIKELKDASKISIKVNPKDFDYIKEEFNSREYIEILSDDAIVSGGVIILSDVGNIDAQISARLKKVSELVQDQ